MTIILIDRWPKISYFGIQLETYKTYKKNNGIKNIVSPIVFDLNTEIWNFHDLSIKMMVVLWVQLTFNWANMA